MNLLEQWTPAETLLLLEGARASHRLALEATLLHLLSARALELDPAEKPSEGHASAFLTAGPELARYGALEHEQVFLRPFLNRPEERLLFKNLVQVAFERSRSRVAFARVVRRSPRLRECFRRGLLELVLVPGRKTPGGREAEVSLRAELLDAERELGRTRRRAESMPRELLARIGGHVLLLPGSRAPWIADEKTFAAIENRTRSQGGCGPIFAGVGCGTLHGYRRDFDEAADEVASHDASAASGDGDGAGGCDGGGGDGGGSGCSGGGGD